MADKDKFADEMLTDDELEKVAGGGWWHTDDEKISFPNNDEAQMIKDYCSLY